MSDNCFFHRRLSRAALRLLAVAVFFSMSLFAANASATVMKYAGLERLVEISDLIVQGTVSEQKTYFDKAQGRVVTDTTFSVTHTFAGKAQKSVTIQQWGGTHDGVTHFIAGDARFDKGEEVVVFLHHGQDGVVALSAMGQSKYSVVSTPKGKIVSRDFSDISILIDPKGVDKSATPKSQLPGKIIHMPVETRALDSFRAELESLIAGIKGANQ